MKKIILLFILLFSVYGWWNGAEKEILPPRGAVPKIKRGLVSASDPKPTPPRARQPASSVSVPAEEKNSIEELSATVAASFGAPGGFAELLQRLKASGQEPFVTRDRNPDTGELLIIRTRSPFKGTRYFHAQYFTDESGEPLVQHVSFEFKPGPEAMQTAVQAVERSFTQLSRPVVQRDGYVMWRMGDDYIVWVKRLGRDDLKDDPFNAYSPADTGTIRVAIEQEIHGD